jgi:hypothetical protein
MKICEFEVAAMVFQRIQVMWDVTLCHCVIVLNSWMDSSAFLTLQTMNPLTQHPFSKDLNFIHKEINCLFLAHQPPEGQGLLIHEVSISHTTMRHGW